MKGRFAALTLLAILVVACQEDSTEGRRLEIVEEWWSGQLVRGVDTIDGTDGVSYYLKENGVHRAIKHPYVFRERTDRIEGWRDHLAGLISIDAFNEYIRSKGVSDRSVVMEHYCQLLALPPYLSFAFGEPYAIIESDSGLRSFYRSIPKADFHDAPYLAGEFISPDSVQIVTDAATRYCWFTHKGLWRMHFEFEDSTDVRRVNTDLVGYFGSEYLQ